VNSDVYVMISVLSLLLAAANVSLVFAWRRIYELTRWKDECARVHTD